MPKRTICIQKPSSIKVEQYALSIYQEGSLKGRISLDDIWVVIIETHQAQITTAALSKLVDAGIGVMFCGADHMPNGLLLPIGAHSRHAEIVEDQLAISKPLQKRLWQKIVQSKITNQARVLDLLGGDSAAIKMMVKEVQSGDSSNRESVAASAYFKKVLPAGGRRDGPYSAALDYGYTVLRAGVARTAVAGGWLVSRGIHHCNNLNAFNLVDDLIEPFRPVVDYLVVFEDMRGSLDSELKHKLAEIFEYMVRIPSGTVTLQTAIENELDTLKAAVKTQDYNLLELPEIVPLQKAAFE